MTASVPAAPPAVKAEDLRKAFGHREALKGIDLEAPEKGCYAIFGHNGAGKSTLLRIIATRMAPTSGRLEVLGLEPRRHGPRVRSSLGVVFHDTFLRGDLTLDENLRFYADLYGVSRANFEARSDSLVARMGLSARRFDPVRTYSQGMAKRSTLIRSLLHDPRVWILDEPFSGLDPAGAALLEEMIAEERAGGRAIVLVTHDVETGLRLADDGIAIGDGKVLARGKDGLREFVKGWGSGGSKR